MTDSRTLAASAAQGEPSPAPRALRVVVVDDERDTALTLMMLLRDEGHEVRALYRGADVPKTVRDFAPDAVVLDIALPDTSGYDVAKAIRAQQGARAPLLIGISGQYKQGSDRILAQMSGFDHYLVKPFPPQTLIDLLAPLGSPGLAP